MKQFFGMPQWFRIAARNFLVSGIVAYLACEVAVWYFQPTYRWPVFLAMPIIWWFGFWVMASSGRIFAGMTLRNIVTFASNERHRHLVLKFRRRAIWARVTARVTIGCMVMLTGAMVYLLLFAGALMQGDAAYTLRASTERVVEVVERLGAFNAANLPALPPEELETLTKYRAELEAIQAATPVSAEGQPADTVVSDTIGRLNLYLDSRESLLELAGAAKDMREDVEAAWGARSELDESGVPQFLAVQAARFGGIAVLCAMLFALVQFYRYHLKLSAHYDARADVIELVQSDDIEKLVKGVEMFSPDALDFGPQFQPMSAPKRPVGKAVASEMAPRTEPIS